MPIRLVPVGTVEKGRQRQPNEKFKMKNEKLLKEG